MANNAGRQGGAGVGGGGNTAMNEHVEFTVKAEEDLYLTGTESTVLRVTAETNYSCLMLKTQRFSSLFRHYAKYHGLRKDDLEYYFVNLLEHEDTPESVQLQRADTIMVRKRRKPEPPEPASDDEEFFKDMRELLKDDEHMDVTFLVEDFVSLTKEQDCPQTKPWIEIRAHKCILTARAEHFKALFRNNASASGSPSVSYREVAEGTIKVDPVFSSRTIQLMLEFLYTNRIQNIEICTTDELLALLHLADMWVLRDLKRLTEHELIRTHMDVKTVARMYCASEDFQAQRLARACMDYIMENIREVTGNKAFQEEMKHYPHLCIPMLKAAADLIPEPAFKKQRTNDPLSSVKASSSPVPDNVP
mmetsp:Transcript_15026/g.22872  ORF Transcript_15026/g.22872 Transcript_15026/m.22872 type:complete len:362 (-) Transcript_15026:1630-2715(-)